MSGPTAYVSTHAATSFVVTVTALQGAGGTALALHTRALGSASDWTTQDSDATPTAGQTLTASGLTQDAPLEWRVVETVGATTYDGTHGIVTPAASIWATLTATVSTALQGQGMASASICTGYQPEPNAPTPCAILRTTSERVKRRANNMELVEFPVRVEVRYVVTTDDGAALKASGDLWQRRIESALHEKHAGDFPGVAGLEEVTVEVESKDDHGDADTYGDEIRARATVRFAVWRAK